MLPTHYCEKHILHACARQLSGGLHEWENTRKSLIPILKIIPLM